MRIGIVPSLTPDGGGIYQYSLTMLQHLREMEGEGCEDEFVVFDHRLHHPMEISLNEHGWAVAPLQPPPSLKQQILDVLRHIVGEGVHRDAWRWSRRILQRGKAHVPDPDVVQSRPDMRRWFHHWGVELVLYPTTNALSFEIGIPYVMAIHDLQHLLQPEFPEVSAGGEWEMREHLFRNGIRRALMILVESETGKEDVLNYYGRYGVAPDKVKVLPMLPANYLTTHVSESEKNSVRQKYNLPQNFLFYPAQFWLHKNHGRIVQALGQLKAEHSLEVPIVFCGSHGGQLREQVFKDVMQSAKDLKVEQQVKYLGYVPEAEMSALYAMATALVMPTFFGATNIPPLEAFAFGCPVVTSNIRGIREQMGDAAILVDPLNSVDIARGIHRVVTDHALRATLVQRGYARLSRYTPADYARTLKAILKDAKERRNAL
jgi:glycosyltransferase involved in cell wall biosynthesis